MKTNRSVLFLPSALQPVLLCIIIVLTAAQSLGATRYVNLNNPSPVPPYVTWATAATNIQDAVDSAQAGDTVLVTNGVYATGGLAVDGLMTNRVAVTKPLILESVNGPALTVIQGYQIPGTTNGDGAVRCLYLSEGAVLAGFTLTNGATRTDGDGDREQSAGGVWCPSLASTVSNCVVTHNSADHGGGVSGGTLNNCTLCGNSARSFGGGAAGGALNNCTFEGNSARYGGGVSDGLLNNCTLSNNFAESGGGVSGGVLENCTLAGNSADDGGGASGAMLKNCNLRKNLASYGGGANGGTLSDCTLSGNSASVGGGVFIATLSNCTLNGNSAYAGGGAAYSTLNNCALVANSATDSGGGASGGTLNNSALTGYLASYGGGASSCNLKNCIACYNTARFSGDNFDSYSILNYCCTTPSPKTGTGNISTEPQLASAFRLSAGSPCRRAGNASYIGGLDIDSELWANPPSIGCDEYRTGGLTGPLSVGLVTAYTNVAAGFAVQFTAQIQGANRCEPLGFWGWGRDEQSAVRESCLGCAGRLYDRVARV